MKPLSLSRIHANCVHKANGCKLWKGAVSRQQCPCVYDASAYASGAKQTMANARRIVYARANGEIPAGRLVVLTCRNPTCLEPSHMQAMTQLESRRFAAAGGAYDTLACKVQRIAIGRRNALLSWDEADAVRARVLAGEPRLDVARSLGVHRSVVDKIVSGTRYVQRAVANNSVFNIAA